MCGRFTRRYTWAEYYEAINIIPASAKGRNDPPRYNIAPTQTVGFVCLQHDVRTFKEGRWWLVPSWAKELNSKWPAFNARIETVHEKRTFSHSFRYHHCLIPADGYYEWTKNPDDGQKDPHYIYLADNEPFAFAGLWAYNKTLDVTSCTIITAPANDNIAHLHSRMPIILKPEAFSDWLQPSQSIVETKAVLEHHRAMELVSHRVDRRVGNSKIDGPEGRGLIEPTSVR